MRHLSAAGRQAIRDLSQAYGFSPDAVTSMLKSVADGHGRMAQFSHPEFGGAGQWMRGGMTMVSDMFNAALKSRVEGLCEELSVLLSKGADLFDDPPEVHGSRRTGADWWPAGLGRPDSAGAQNTVRYAYFATARRLAIDEDGRITVYDTLDHRIGGVAQQQSVGGTLTFSSQRGPVEVAMLPVVSGDRGSNSPPDTVATPDIVATIEKLADLRRKGILSDEEFSAKKAELLRRI